MAIKVNVISENNAFNVENANYCTVALPITSCWGPAFLLPTAFKLPELPKNPTKEETEAYTKAVDEASETVANAFENTAWSTFQAGPEGLESFIATYRGPSSNYRSTKDYSYFMALTLLNAGYAVQTCRLCPGTYASTSITEDSSSSGNVIGDAGSLIVTAKYPGTFGNNLKVSLRQKKAGSMTYWNLIGYATDANGNTTAVENLVFVFNPENSTDNIVAINELQSKFFTFAVDGEIDEKHTGTTAKIYSLEGGSDVEATTELDTPYSILQQAIALAKMRGYDEGSDYYAALNSLINRDPDTGEVLDPPTNISLSTAESLRFNEWVYTYAVGNKVLGSNGINGVYDLLKDKINYNPNRVISPWDDQDILAINPDYDVSAGMSISMMHKELMEVAADSRCATAYIDVPRSLPRSKVWNEGDENGNGLGYAQKLSHDEPTISDSLYASNSALFAPWGQYVYSGTTRQAPATPSFMALLIDRAMIKNQAAQYEWALPNTRNNNVRLGQLAYKVPKALLDNWQASDGTRVNTITSVPSLGTTIWGNATLFDVPVATYNALQNLSTRKLINAVKDTVFKIGIGLEFQYNGQEAYAKFFAGITPLLDTMRNVGEILDYKVKMAADINNIDSINANSVVGTVYLVIAGVIENITVDLIALPQGTDLNQY